jgi:preprotein translocase subunit SecA
MLRSALSARIDHLGQAPWVEAADARQNALDKWLLKWMGRLQVWGSALARYRLRRFAKAVMVAGQAHVDADDAQLLARAAEVGARLRVEGLSEAAVIDSFALVREVAGRRLGKRHYPVQVMGGRVMLDGGIAEMQTGEGKTLTALLPAVTMALAGVPVHVVTVNEYLAARDADIMEPVYAFFGLTVGRVLPDQQPPERAKAYRCDVAYCVNKDLTFDYLRDRIEALAGRLGPRAVVSQLTRAPGSQQAVMRGLWFAIVDEADSVFIDEARTPLIISQGCGRSDAADVFDAALALASRLDIDRHFLLRARERQALLTEAGRQAVIAVEAPLLPDALIERERLIEQALTALHGYELDRHYIVAEGKVQIVDEYTGRVMPDRSWEGGLHQLIERKEGLDLTKERRTTARITYQRVFRRYLRVGGMSGTITEVAGELKSVLGVNVVRIPTHRRVRRRSLGTRLFVRSEGRDQAVVEAARREAAKGRAVLIGTRSVAASERLGQLCAQAGLAPTVLNAKQDADEAAIIGQAGQRGRVTVATNMAGRGTDIGLDDEVRQAGGLHVILTEFHDSTRIDRQLFGRAGRQGDPGSYECLVALDDELFLSHAPKLTDWLMRRARLGQQAHIHPMWARVLRWWAQTAAERHHAETRQQTLEQEKTTDRLLAFAGRPE